MFPSCCPDLNHSPLQVLRCLGGNTGPPRHSWTAWGVPASKTAEVPCNKRFPEPNAVTQTCIWKHCLFNPEIQRHPRTWRAAKVEDPALPNSPGSSFPAFPCVLFSTATHHARGLPVPNFVHTVLSDGEAPPCDQF